MIIYKYEIALGQDTIKVPRGAKYLDCQMQGGTAVLWFEVDYDLRNTEEELGCAILFTGQEYEITGLEYRKTLQVNGLVYHVYLG